LKGPIAISITTNTVTISSDKTVRTRAIDTIKSGVQLRANLEICEHHKGKPPTYLFLKASNVILGFLKYCNNLRFVVIMRN